VGAPNVARVELSGTVSIVDIAIVYSSPTSFMNNAFMNMNQEEQEHVRRMLIVIKVSARDRLAPRICKE
jgi:hypothetical protein